MLLDLESRRQPEEGAATVQYDLRSELTPNAKRGSDGDPQIAGEDRGTNGQFLDAERLTLHRPEPEYSNGTTAPDGQAVVIPLQQPPIVFFFRKNGLYEKYCEQLCTHLDRQGLPSRMVTFPVGTTPEFIHAEVERFADSLKGCVIFADETVKKHLNPRAFPGLAPNSLNHIFSVSCLQIVCHQLGLDYSSLYNTGGATLTTQEYLLAHRPRFEKVFREAVRRANPDNIIIDLRSIRQDPPFFVFGGDGTAEAALRVELEQAGVLDGSVQQSDAEGRTTPDPDGDAATLLREWIVRAGYPRERIILTDSIAALSPELFADSTSVWLVEDHHVDKGTAQREIADFQASIEKLRLGKLIEASLLDDGNGEEGERMLPLEEERTMRREVYDGDDGLDDPESLDELSFPEGVPDEGAGSRTMEEIEERLARLEAFAEAQRPFKLTVLPLGMDFLVLEMIETRLLPAEHFRKGKQLVRLALDSVQEAFAKAAPLAMTQYNPPHGG